MQLSSETKFAAGLGVALALLILTILGEGRTVARFQSEQWWVDHTDTVIELLQSTLVSLDTAAISERAFIITGKQQELAPYHAAISAGWDYLGQLRELTADNPREQSRLDVLDPLVKERFARLQRTAEARKANPLSETQLVPLFSLDSAAAARIAQEVSEMVVEEHSLLKERRAGLNEADQRTRDFGVFGTIVALVLVGVAGIFLYRDSSARREASRKLTAHAGRLEQQAQLLDLTQDAIFVRRLDGQIIFWNRGAETLYGWTKDEALGSFSQALLKTVFPAPFHEIEVELRRSGYWQGELVHRKKDGARVAVISRWALRQNASGGTPDILETNTDVTNEKQAAEALAEKAMELERSNGELAQFAYVASHDLQEPLRMISSYVQLLARRYHGQLGTEADEYIHFAVDGAARMQVLIQDLLAYSRVGAKRKAFEPVPARESLECALVNLQGAMKESGASVAYNGLPTVRCDASQLTQLFQNLVGNAIKYRREEPPQILVDAEVRGEEWIFSVRDNGIGIDPQYYDRIFTIFQRLHSRAEYSGTGIGLAICKKIVERHSGRIWVESQPGAGSTFYFTIPA